jgi:hypothetical protein
VLELGESEWYGDIGPERLAAIIGEHAPGPARAGLAARLADVLEGRVPHRSFELAKLFYRALLDYETLQAIDFHGTPAAMKIDLNYPTGLAERYDMVIDNGTAEHVFNVAQFFASCHELTRPGGLMVHATPFVGWIEHGFYTFQPTFYWDLAAANGYAMVMLVYTEIDPMRVVQLQTRERIVELARSGAIGRNAMLYAVLKKNEAESGFVLPRQGYYAGALSPEMDRAWQELR